MNEKVAVLGPKGTFTDKAAKVMYPEASITYLEDVEEVFKRVAGGGILGVAAVENSLEGSVGQTLECLLNYDVRIVGATTLGIDLCIMAPKGVKREDIRVIMSHSHALAQCKKHIKKGYPHAKTQATSSTTDAMREAFGRKDAAAIGFSESGLDYGLTTIEASVQDEQSETRFIALSKTPVKGGKTSLIFAVKDEPGALYHIIKEFAAERLNMTKIESRPSRKRLGEYIFYVDYGNNSMREEDMGRFHEKLKAKTTYFKELGSY